MKKFVLWARSLWPFGDHMIIPERRQSMRYLTLKNAVRAAVALAVAFILLSVWSALRPAHSGTPMFEPRVTSSASPSADREPLATVPEGSVHDYPEARLVPNDVPVAPSSTNAAPQKTVEPRESPLGKGQRIVISGGSEGVHLQVEKAPPAASTPPHSQ